MYNRHIDSKKHTLRTKNKGYRCGCGNVYMSHQSLYSHRKKCESYNNEGKGEKNSIEQLIAHISEQNQLLKQDNEGLRKQMALLLEKGISTHHTNNSNNNTTNNIETQNVIVVNAFGNENTEYLTDQIVSKLIQNGPFTCLPKIIERIHFDPDHPENHNIKVTNQKTNYAKIVKDNKWITTNKKQAIDKMIQSGYDILEEKYNENKECIPEFKQERFEDFQQKYESDERQLMKTIKDTVDITLINGTNHIYKT
jgi:hypothetical protein